MRRVIFRILAVVALGATTALLAGCGSGVGDSVANKPIPADTVALMHKMGLRENAPVLVRIFKRESELEIWKQRDDGRYALLKTYPICRWSGDLGPKLNQGDKQAPEGFYAVGMGQLNPRSNYHLSFNIGFPNALDKAYDRTGNFIMVHGDCRSAGCYAMTDALIEEIYAIVREALTGGQEKFQIQALPFRMTEENMKRYGTNKRWQAFWRDLKKGYDAFEQTRIPPKISVCERRYLVNVAFEGQTDRFGAADLCPPHHGYVPMIEETPQGPRIIEADAATANRYYAAQVTPADLRPESRPAAIAPAGTASLTSPQDLALRNSLAISR
jgi:murein L,D-transpeptidase YafK